MRITTLLLLAVGLAACAPSDQTPPESARQEPLLGLEVRVSEYIADTAIISCKDGVAGSTCACFGVMSCVSARWASTCEPGTEQCSDLHCTCSGLTS